MHVRRQNKQPVLPALLQHVPFVAYVVAAIAWLAAPGSTIVKEHLILFYMVIGFVFGRIAAKIILAHVTKMEYPHLTVLYFPLWIGALLANAPLFGL